MPNYKIAVSKSGKKYTIVFKADNEKLAKERVHSEGYSILGLEEINEKKELGNVFIFEGYKDGKFKHGKIVGADIFKAYTKLKKDLEYDIETIYNEKDENISIESKEKIIKELKQEYEMLYFKSKKEENTNKDTKKINSENKERPDLDSFFMKKELEDVNKLIDHILIKVEQLLSGELNIKLTNKKLEKLKIIYNEIIKLRKTTNISKLKEVGELALMKIGNIELQELEKTKKVENRKFLKETNDLLRKIGSKDKFIEKNRDIKYQYNLFIDRLNSILYDFKNRRKKQEIDKESYSYMKNLLYIAKYKQRYKENTKFIIFNFYKIIFNKSLREEIFLKRKVIKQNIILLKAKEKGINYSYTLVKKGIGKFLKNLKKIIEKFNEYLFFILIFYTIIFFIYLNFNVHFRLNDYNYEGIFYFIIMILVYILLHFSKNIILLIINFVFLSFIIIFGVINF